MRILLSVIVALGALFVVAPPAQANGIMVTGDATMPPPPTLRRPPPVRLKDHKVTAVVRDAIAEVTVEQTFSNESGVQLEGTYLFPLPEGAVVSKFAMTMFGKMVQGEIIEANKARGIYQSIVRRRRDPGLLEYMGRGLFRARVFPIEPRKDLTIRLTFQQVLADDAGTLELRYPLATDRMNGSPVAKVFIDVKVESTVDLKAIYSPTHTVEVNREGERKARVTYERSGLRQKKDFLLYVGRSPDAVGFSFLSQKAPAQDGTFMAVLAPRFDFVDAEQLPRDVVFVLDTSGSMAGPKIEQARAALTYGVRTLKAGDRFNIIGFATGLNPFRDGLVDATAELKEAAARWITGLKATGGTNIEGALTQALQQESKDRLFMVVFITDGRPTVGSRDAKVIVDGVAKANTSNARVFTFGVGYDLDVKLLDTIAESTRGARDYVTPGEDIEIVTGRFFRKVSEPVMSDVTVEFGEGVYDVYPQKLPDLFAGGQVVVFGRYREPGDRVIRLKGRMFNKEQVQEYEATFRTDGGADFLPRLWAHRKVAFLLDEIRLRGHNQELVDEVVKLATRHAIVTPYTAGLVVEESELATRQDFLRRAPRRRIGVGGGTGGSFRGPSSGIPPHLREPSDPTPPPPALPAGSVPLPTPTTPAMPPPVDPTPPPMTTPAPSAPARPQPGPPAPEPKPEADASKDLSKRKKGIGGKADESDYGDLRARIETVAGKTFLQRRDGRWIDTAWDGKKETTKVESMSDAYFELLAKDKKVAKYLALGERVVFVLGDSVYEIVPATK